MTNEEFIKSISFEGEEWRDIKDFEGLYMISSCGRILSCSKEVMGGNGLRKTKPKLSIPGECRGYYQARLYKNNKQHCPYIHRLVAEAFIINKNKNDSKLNSESFLLITYYSHLEKPQLLQV